MRGWAKPSGQAAGVQTWAVEVFDSPRPLHRAVVCSGAAMTMQPVRSSNIESVGYEDGTMHVKFKSGKTYVFAEVPTEAHAAFVGADSVGKHFAAHIKGKYQGSREI